MQDESGELEATEGGPVANESDTTVILREIRRARTESKEEHDRTHEALRVLAEAHEKTAGRVDEQIRITRILHAQRQDDRRVIDATRQTVDRVEGGLLQVLAVADDVRRENKKLRRDVEMSSKPMLEAFVEGQQLANDAQALDNLRKAESIRAARDRRQRLWALFGKYGTPVLIAASLGAVALIERHCSAPHGENHGIP